MKPVALVRKVSAMDWSFHNSATQQLAHGIHRYSGKYIPQIARTAIGLISEPGELVLDPYVGSGTTLIEANQAKRRSLGIDMSPLAVLVSSAKINPIAQDDADALLAHFREYIQAITTTEDNQRSLLEEKYDTDLNSVVQQHPYYDDEWFTKWFNKRILKELILIHTEISRYRNKDAARIALVAFSNILRRCSNAHAGYPNVMFDKNRQNTNSAYKLFLRELSSACSKVTDQLHVWDNNMDTSVELGDARKLRAQDDSIDAIVTHPPYIGSVPYAEYGVLSLKWLGHDPKELDRRLTGGKRQRSDVVSRFREDYRLMLKESYRVLKPNKYMFILIGHPKVRGEVIDLADMTIGLAESVGFKLVVRKARNGTNKRANKMGHEDLMFFMK